MKEKLPHATTSLVLGIVSIVTCCLAKWGIPLILSVLGFLQANKAIKLHNENPEEYDGIGNAKAGKIISIIGIVISILLIILVIYGKANPDMMIELQEWAEEMKAQQQ